jgi:GNAT superfamily N-acetyltransferase
MNSQEGWSVVIRQAVASDREAVGDLFKEMFDFHKERDPHFSRSNNGHEVFANWFVRQIAESESLPLVAEVEGEVVGYSLGIIRKHSPVFQRRNYGEINDIAVTERYRRLGIGQKFFGRTREWFHSRGIERIEVRVASTNEVSLAFWRKMGFQSYLETLFIEDSTSDGLLTGSTSDESF